VGLDGLGELEVAISADWQGLSSAQPGRSPAPAGAVLVDSPSKVV